MLFEATNPSPTGVSNTAQPWVGACASSMPNFISSDSDSAVGAGLGVLFLAIGCSLEIFTISVDNLVGMPPTLRWPLSVLCFAGVGAATARCFCGRSATPLVRAPERSESFYQWAAVDLWSAARANKPTKPQHYRSWTLGGILPPRRASFGSCACTIFGPLADMWRGCFVWCCLLFHAILLPYCVLCVTNLLARGAPSNNQTGTRLPFNVSFAPPGCGTFNELTYQADGPWPPNENAKIAIAVIAALIVVTHGIITCRMETKDSGVRSYHIMIYYISFALVTGIAFYGVWLPPRTTAASFLRFPASLAGMALARAVRAPPVP